jgi:hypothetical protein
MALLFRNHREPMTPRRCRVKVGTEFNLRDWNPLRDSRATELQRERAAEARALLREAARIAEIAESLWQSGDPKHTIFAAEGLRRLAQTRGCCEVRHDPDRV